MAVKREYDSSRRQRQAAQTRADILQAARRLFSERGYAATTIEAIAAEAQVAEATVYAGFGSKRGILLAFQQLMEENADLGERVRAFHAAGINIAAPEAVDAVRRSSIRIVTSTRRRPVSSSIPISPAATARWSCIASRR